MDAEPERTLLTVLRDELDLTGTKYGCGEGQCGACTVMIDGAPARSCQTRAGRWRGQGSRPSKGWKSTGVCIRFRKRFLKSEAMQCGYCTPGMIVSGAALLRKNANPDDAEILQAMQGNVCRCGTYPRIVAAMRSASRKMGAPHDTLRTGTLRVDGRPGLQFSFGRRGFFKTLGGGIVVASLLPPGRRNRVDGTRRRAMPKEIGAWLHIDGRAR